MGRACVHRGMGRHRTKHPFPRSSPMHALTKFTLASLLVLSVQSIAPTAEPHGKGELPVFEALAIVERPSEPANANDGKTIERFALNGSLELARKRLLDPQAANWQEAAVSLARDERGRAVLEEIIVL